MTSQDGAPGAAAVYLYREQVTDDTLHMYSYYVRLKVLTEGGKDKANVELPYFSGADRLGIDSIAGRTIHPDGTIIPFTGKPYEKLIAKGQGYQAKAKVFTLPSVEVGSIVEYRYKFHYDDQYVRSPDWYVQSDTFMRKAHYMWRPSTRMISDAHDGIADRISWYRILPAGMDVKQTEVRGKTSGTDGAGGLQMDLEVTNIPALPLEAFMPPAGSLGYRVLFYYTGYRGSADFWKSEGKRWSKAHNTFIGPGNGVKAFVQQTIAAGDTQDQKLKKLYDAVMTFDNTDFNRAHSASEDKGQGLKQVSTTDDILQRKRGTGDQLDDLFIAMARAAGLKAYVLGVANREKRVFLPEYQSMSQLDDDLAIVEVDGKELVFDPGQRYCEYKQLAWVHSQSAGLRQTEAGVELIPTPTTTAKGAHVTRVADLALDEHGIATGSVTMTLTGNPALHWRQEALTGDDTSLNTELRSNMEQKLPGGMEVRVKNVENLSTYDKPLVVTYEVKGAVGTPTGKRLLVAANLFESGAKPLFPEAKREQAIFMHYPTYVQDAVRIKYPASLTLEASPKAEDESLQTQASYRVSTKQVPGSVTSYRDMMLANAIFMVGEYPELKSFYSKLETTDQEPLVFLQVPAGHGASGGVQ